MSRLLAWILILAALLACDRRPAVDAEPAEQVAGADSDAPADAAEAPRVYHNLTRYPWYARAEPLMYEQRAYQPRGLPVALPLAKLRRAGHYQGVDFYVFREDEATADAVYVPVSDGYWLPFVAALENQTAN